MAGSPPPYPPPPPGSPWGFDPRQQARIARQQEKMRADAQKAAYRAQRNLYCLQARAMQRGSILGPLLVLAIGVVLLLLRLGRIPFGDFWNLYGRWWPALLVGAGLILVAEWAFDQMPRADGTSYVRRGLGGGAVFLLLLLAALGFATHMATVHGIGHSFTGDNWNWGWNSDSFDEFLGNKHELTQSTETAFPAGTSLAVDNPHGDVTIVGRSGDDKVHVVVNKQVWSQSDSDADAKAQQLSPQMVLNGSVLNVTLPAMSGAIADLSITVPEMGETTVNANHGAVTISGMRAPVTVTANHGDVQLNGITGTVSAHVNNSNSSFTAHQITGDVTVHGHADDLSVTDVSGRVTFDGEFNGDTHLERLRGPMSFHTSRTQFSLERLDGAVDISPQSDLNGSEIVGPMSLRTRSRNIRLDRVAGSVDVTDSDGSVEVTGAPPLGNISIENRNGEVNVTVPEHAGFSVDAETNGGEIENDMDLKTSSQHNRTELIGTVAGGGPKITVRTTHLDIGIHQKPEAPLAPQKQYLDDNGNPIAAPAAKRPVPRTPSV